MHCYKSGCGNRATHFVRLMSPNEKASLLVASCCDQHLALWKAVRADGSWKEKLSSSLLLASETTAPTDWSEWSLSIKRITAPTATSPETPTPPVSEMHRKIKVDSAVYCQWDTETIGGDNACDHDFDPEPKALQSTYIEFSCTRCGQRIQIGVWE